MVAPSLHTVTRWFVYGACAVALAYATRLLLAMRPLLRHRRQARATSDARSRQTRHAGLTNALPVWLRTFAPRPERQEIAEAIREADELEAISHLRAGDQDTLTWFAAQYGVAVWHVCRGVLRAVPDAQEAWSDTFLRLWRNIDQWDPSRGTLRAWLLALAKHASLDVGRRLGRPMETLAFQHAADESDLLDRHHGTEPEAGVLAEHEEMLRILADALARIENTNHRVAFSLRHIDEPSIEEVANALDANPPAVKVWVWRATQSLRLLLGPRPRSRRVPRQNELRRTLSHPVGKQGDHSEVVDGRVGHEVASDVEDGNVAAAREAVEYEREHE